MAGRYSSSTVYEFGRARGASNSPVNVYDAVQTGTVSAETYVFQEGDRLDVLAGKFYGDSTLWWIIAAASGIGWGFQVPPGTRILIPNFVQVRKII
jgi:nucleoid-associated protein YgaU